VHDRLPGAEVRFISARSGEGVETWLGEMLAGGPSGRRIAAVDYDIYAEGEAALGWLNALIHLSAAGGGADWRAYCRAVLAALQQAFRHQAAEVGHVKLLLAAAGGQLVGNLTRTEGDVSLRGELAGRPDEASLLLNARVEMAPAELEQLARRCLADAAGPIIRVDVRHLQSLRPGRPQPTYRYDRPA